MKNRAFFHSLAASIFNVSVTLSALENTWIGGADDNNLLESSNWDPSGPPGSNSIALFDTTENPPILPISGTMNIGLTHFLISGVEVEVLGDLTIGDIQNDFGTTTIFNLSSSGTMTVEGTLSTEGISNFISDGAYFYMESENSSNANFTLGSGSTLIIDYTTEINTLSSSSTEDLIILNADLTIGNAENQTINGFFSGESNLIKQGSGTVSLNGDSIMTGTINVLEGQLTVNGVLSPSSSTHLTSGVLKGTGTLGNVTVGNEATVAPGNSVGTLHTGSIIFSSGSIYETEINPTEASLLDVSGIATLAGSVRVVQNAGSYLSNGKYLILNASEGIEGTFDPHVLGGLPGYAISLQYSGNRLYLLYSPGASNFIPTSTLSGNALKLANYLNENASSSTLSLFSELPENALSNALNSVSPARNGFVTYIAEQIAFSLSNLVATRLDDFRISNNGSIKEVLKGLTADSSDKLNAASLEDKKGNSWNPWISGFGGYFCRSGSLQNPSFDFFSEAVLAGLDYQMQNRNLAGVSLGYAHTHYNDNGHAGNGNGNSYFLSLYGNGFIGNFYLSPALWGIFNQTAAKRNISFPGFSDAAHADIFAWQFVPHLEAGYDIRQNWGDIIPFTSADWAISWQREYSEKGASPFNTKQKSNNNSMARSETGLKLSQKWGKTWGEFFLKEKISYIFEKPYGTGTVNASFTGMPQTFTVQSVQNNLNLGGFGLDFVFAIDKKNPTFINVAYEGEFGNNYWSSSLQLNLIKNF